MGPVVAWLTAAALSLLACCSSFAQANKFWNGSTSSDWFNPTNWIPAGVPATNDNIYVTNYTTIELTAPVTIYGQFNWQGGNLTGSNGLTIATNGVLNIGGSSFVDLYVPLTNQGLVQWQSATVYLINNGASSLGTIWNQPGALWDIQCDAQIRGLSGQEQFQNAGTLRKSAGPGTTSFSLPLLNSGTVVVLAGVFDLNGGGPMDGDYNAAAGTLVQFDSGAFTYSTIPVFTGAGAFQFTGGTLTLADDVIPNLAMLGGTVLLGTNFQGGTITNLTLPGSTLSGNYSVSGTFNCGNGLSAGSLQVAAGGTMNWSGGYMYGPLTVSSNAVLNLNGTIVGLLAPLTNQASVNWQSGELDIYYNGSSSLGALWNLPGASWNIQCDALLFGTSQGQFQNAGTVRKLAGTGTTRIDVAFLNSGTLSAWQGTIALNGGLTNNSGTLECGLANSNNFGQLSIQGNTLLSGDLNVLLLGGFVPALSNSFAVVNYGSATGLFASVTLPAAGVWVSNYGPTAFTATVINVSKLAFTSSPSGATAGAVLAPVAVQVEDLNGNPIATNGLPITLSLSAGSGVLSGTLTRATDSTGKATFSDLSINLAGPKMLQASCAPGGLSPVISGAFLISAAAPVELSLVVPSSSPEPDGYAFSPAPVVAVADRFGNFVSNSTALLTAQLASGGGGTLQGVTNVNANGLDGSASFGNLRYRLNDSNTAESVTISFSSPGLNPVTNATISVLPVFRTLTLQDHNSVIQIDPTSEQGMFSWTVDGVEQLFQRWFWLRPGAQFSQTSVDHLGAAYRVAWSSNSAVMRYLTPQLSLQLAFTLQGGSGGSRAASLSESLALTNISGASLSFALFDYADFDLGGYWTNDTLSAPSPQQFLQQGKGMQLTHTVQGPAPSSWEGSFYAITLDELDSGSPANLSDTFIPPAPGDQTFAFQWYTTLNPGQGLLLNFTNVFQPAAVLLSIARAGNNVVVSWPTNGTAGYQLHTISLLPDTGAWAVVTNSPAVLSNLYQLILPQSRDAEFFRLQK